MTVCVVSSLFSTKIHIGAAAYCVCKATDRRPSRDAHFCCCCCCCNRTERVHDRTVCVCESEKKCTFHHHHRRIDVYIYIYNILYHIPIRLKVYMHVCVFNRSIPIICAYLSCTRN